MIGTLHPRLATKVTGIPRSEESGETGYASGQELKTLSSITLVTDISYAFQESNSSKRISKEVLVI